MKILFSGFRYAGHSKYGGYDWIRNYPNADYVSDNDCFFRFIKSGKRGKVLNLFFLDKKTRRVAEKYDLLHCFYGDYTIFTEFPTKRKYKVIATVHQNVEKSIPHHKNILQCLKSLDGVVCLSSQQANDLKKYGLNTIFIPHGFNKPKFKKIDVHKVNSDFSDNNINIVCIGRQYRDYETLFKIVHEMQKNNHIKFHFIGGDPIVKEKLSQYANVRIYGRLNDDEYYTLISQCDWNFLPLTYATANNALMESSYLGIRSILPKISGVTDYGCPNENFFYQSYEELIQFFSNIENQKPSETISSYAEKFSWQNIYIQLEKFYQSVL